MLKPIQRFEMNDKEPLYENILKDMGYNVSVFIDSTYIDGDRKYHGLDNSHDKKIEIDCNDCKCGKLYENTVPLIVMLISEQVDSLIGRPGYIQVEVNDSYRCEDEIKNPIKGRGCGGTKRKEFFFSKINVGINVLYSY